MENKKSKGKAWQACFAAIVVSLAIAASKISPANTIPGLFNTGVDEQGVRLLAGSAERHYLLQGPAASPTVFDENAPASGPGGWVAPAIDAMWIGPAEGTSSGPDGDYIYTLAFDLTGFSPATVTISGQWSADNNSAISLNGQTTGFTSPGAGYGSLHSFTINGGFVSGINTLEFHVTNIPLSGSGTPPDLFNPTGLLVQNLQGEAMLIPSIPLITTSVPGNLVFEVLEGHGGTSILEFGFGTPDIYSIPEQRDRIFLIHMENENIVNVEPAWSVDMGYFPAGSTFDFYNYSTWGAGHWAFSSTLNSSPSASDLEVFTDRNNSLGWDGSVVETVGRNSWILHLDDASSTDDDDNEMIISISVRQSPDIQPSESSHDYGSIPVGFHTDWTLTIFNEGEADLSITNLDGLETSDFSIVDPPTLPIVIAPQTSTELTVRFAPSSEGPKATTLSIISNDPDESLVEISLTGIGAYPSLLYVDVDAPGANNGTSWQDAFVHLQDALGYAEAYPGHVQEIRVAHGIYNPDSNSVCPDGTGDREATFNLLNGIALKGGYAGYGEADPNARDVETYETVLSGDLIENDDEREYYGPGVYNDNSIHVVTVIGTNEATILDGVTVAGGNADGSGSNSYGGGVYMVDASPKISNCKINGNYGGGIYDSSGGGGGMYCFGGNPTITNCVFNSNLAGESGSLYESYSYSGGGIYLEESNPILSSCTFSNNGGVGENSSGGALYCLDSTPVITNCTFTDNYVSAWSGNYGGGIYCSGGNPEIISCIFINNEASGGDFGYGGAICCSSGSPTLTNCIFLANRASAVIYSLGGGLRVYLGGSPELNNCIFIGNTATMVQGWAGDAGGISCDGGNLILTNCILWHNLDTGGYDESAQISCNSSSPWDPPDECGLTINYCSIQGWTGQLGGVGNIGEDPLFADPNGPDGDPNTWEDNDYHLKSQAGRWDPNTQVWVYDDVSSPCIDAGDPASDWTGEWWPNGMRINMGAYGGTAEASKSSANCGDGNVADLNNDGIVNDADYALFSIFYRDDTKPGDLNDSGATDMVDLGVFSDNWLDMIEQGLVGYWKLDERGGGRAWDSSCQGNHGTLANFPEPAPWNGTGLPFDGIDDYIEVPDSPSLDCSGGITISTWVYLYAYGDAWPKVVVKPHSEYADPWEMYCIDLSHYGNYPRFIISDGVPGGDTATAADSGYTLALNRWYHIAGTYDGSLMTLYVDGEIVATQPANMPIGQNDMPLSIGSRLGTANPFNGEIDEVRLYDIALTEDNVKAIFGRHAE